MPERPNADPDIGRLSGLRLDRWLLYTRFFKSRSLAARAVAGGHVKRNGERADPGGKVRIGDGLEIVKGHERFVIEVTALPVRRGPAAEARACYFESTRSMQERESAGARLRADRLAMPRTPGRPDKKTRRLLRERHRNQRN
jgi:ribosome-associated heat shock protein Hsp15